MSDRKEYLKKWREEHKEHIKQYKKEYAKNHDSSFKKLQKENKKLQQRIDKAIEYIQENCYINEEDKTEVCSYGDDLNPSYLLEILKGDNND